MVDLLFCADPLHPRQLDPAYEAEASAGSLAGFRFDLLHYEALVEGNLERAVRLVSPPSEETSFLYRGWMLSPDTYALLQRGLAVKGAALVNDAAAYR